MTAQFSRNHFELLGLPVAYSIDPLSLERGYRDLQSRVHPDKFAAASEPERRVAMQWAAQANEAYRVTEAENPSDAGSCVFTHGMADQCLGRDAAGEPTGYARLLAGAMGTRYAYALALPAR